MTDEQQKPESENTTEKQTMMEMQEWELERKARALASGQIPILHVVQGLTTLERVELFDYMQQHGYLVEHPRFSEYYVNDPRFPHFTAEDRYGMDHPAPKTWPKPKSRTGRLQRAEEFLSNPAYSSNSPPDDRVKEVEEEAERDRLRRRRAYICQVCSFREAEWPKEKSKRWLTPLGEFRWIYEVPIVCSTCRMMKNAEVRRVMTDRQRSWWRIRHFITGEVYPSAGSKMRRAIALRNRMFR
jgi:hypothetical protein